MFGVIETGNKVGRIKMILDWNGSTSKQNSGNKNEPVCPIQSN